MAKDGYKVVPVFWWDFEWDEPQDLITSVVVESDHPAHPVIAVLLEDKDATGDWGTWTNAVKNAENLISDLSAGRITIKQAMEKYKE